MDLDLIVGSELPDWSGYFGPLSSATAAIFAIFFVAYQVNTSWRGKNRELQRYSALVALYELAAPLMISLAALLPTPWGGWLLGPCLVGTIGMGLGGYGRHRMYRKYYHKRSETMTDKELKREWFNYHLGSIVNIFVFGATLVGGVSGLVSFLGYNYTSQPGIVSSWLPLITWKAFALVGIWTVAVSCWWLIISGIYQSWRQLSDADQDDSHETTSSTPVPPPRPTHVEITHPTPAPTLPWSRLIALIAAALLLLRPWRRG
ncbi:hypothetical protein [Rhodococcus rhodochrous]|uniref:hypothetical protein n=1 Tax=Rhodococcus rhodochrous TaxID=1829 RepID=UPI0011A0CE04|nr:hypothetical protein [Rhodococcus rhodochrous]